MAGDSVGFKVSLLETTQILRTHRDPQAAQGLVRLRVSATPKILRSDHDLQAAKGLVGLWTWGSHGLLKYQEMTCRSTSNRRLRGAHALRDHVQETTYM